MNQQQLASLVAFAITSVLGYLVHAALRSQMAAPLPERLRIQVEKLFPSLRRDPWLFEPIALDDLPARQRWYFESHTPGFLARGFTHLGDFVLRRDRGKPSCSRHFLSPDQTMIGGVTSYLATQAIECVSVLLDGFYIETSTAYCSQLPPERHGLQFFFIKTDDAGELVEHHRQCVARTAAARSTQPAPLGASDFQAALNYGRQLSIQSLHQQGVLSDLPPFLRAKCDTQK